MRKLIRSLRVDYFNSVPVLPFLIHFMLPEKRSRLSPEVARCIRVENPYVTLLPTPETGLNEHLHRAMGFITLLAEVGAVAIK